MFSRPRRSVLSNRTYRHLFSAQLVALLGTGLLTVALSLLAFDIAPTRAGAVVATALTIKMVAYVGVAPLVTAATAHLAPRTVLLGANIVRAAVAACLPWVAEVWQIYVLIVILQAASATFTPAFQAVIPAVLPDEDDYTRALSLSRLAYDLESVVSPLLAAALLLVISYHGLFVGTVVGFVLSSLLVLSAGLARTRPPGPSDSFWSRAGHGAHLFVQRPPLRALLALNLTVATATALVLVNTIVVVRQDFGLGETAVAVALGAYGTGSMIVAVSVPALLRRADDRPVMLCGAALGPIALVLASLASASEDRWPVLLGAWLLLGASTSFVLTPSGRVINRSVRVDERAAAFAANFSLSHACFLITYPLAGWAGSALGVPTAAIILAVIATLSAAAALVLWTSADAEIDRSVADSAR